MEREYSLFLPRTNEFVTYKPSQPMVTVKEALYQICKEFALVTVVLTDVSLCTLASYHNMDSGQILPADGILAERCLPQDVLVIYGHPFFATVLTEEGGKEISFKSVLDLTMPMRDLLQAIAKIFRITKPKVDYGFLMADSLEAFSRKQWWWINTNHPLGDFPFDQNSVLGVFHLDWWRSVPKSAVVAASTKSGWLRKLSSNKWLERGRAETESDKAWMVGRPQRRHFIYSPPRLFVYKSEFDETPEDVLSIDNFLLKDVDSPKYPRHLSLTRVTKLESGSAKQSLMQSASKLKGGGIKGLGRSLVKMNAAAAVSQYAIFADEFEEEDQVQEWFHVIVPDGMNTGVLQVFGSPLHHCVSRQMGSRLVPQVVSDAIQFLDEFGLETEGIFRVAGNRRVVEYYRDCYDTGTRPSFDGSSNDVHSVASLMKLYLRELPEPLLTFKLYTPFVDVISMAASQEQIDDELVRLCNQQLPDAQAIVLTVLLNFLRRVSMFSDKNKMTLSNLSRMFGPNLLRDSNEMDDPQKILLDSKKVNDITQALINNVHRILPRDSKRTSLQTYSPLSAAVDSSLSPTGKLAGSNGNGEERKRNSSTVEILTRLHGMKFAPVSRRKKIPKVPPKKKTLQPEESSPAHSRSRSPSPSPAATHPATAPSPSVAGTAAAPSAPAVPPSKTKPKPSPKPNRRSMKLSAADLRQLQTTTLTEDPAHSAPSSKSSSPRQLRGSNKSPTSPRRMRTTSGSTSSPTSSTTPTSAPAYSPRSSHETRHLSRRINLLEEALTAEKVSRNENEKRMMAVLKAYRAELERLNEEVVMLRGKVESLEGVEGGVD